MTPAHSIARYVVRYPNISALAYLALVITALVTVGFAVMDVSDRYRARDASTTMLTQLEWQTSSGSSGSGISAPAGSPFLQDQTATLATATLLQRVTDVIARVSGSVTSSEVDPASDHSGASRVKITVNCEIEERALQQLLFHLEAEAPYLFIDRLMVQAPASPGVRMHVVLGIAGLWSGGK